MIGVKTLIAWRFRSHALLPDYHHFYSLLAKEMALPSTFQWNCHYITRLLRTAFQPLLCFLTFWSVVPLEMLSSVFFHSTVVFQLPHSSLSLPAQLCHFPCVRASVMICVNPPTSWIKMAWMYKLRNVSAGKLESYSSSLCTMFSLTCFYAIPF